MLRRLVDHERLAFRIAREQPLFRPLRPVHQQPRIGKLRQIAQVHLARLQKAMDQAQNQQPIRPRRDPDPVIRHRRIAGADRVDRNHPCPPRLQPAEADLDRVRIMILRHPEHHEQLGMFPIRLAELPKRTADGVDARRRHVDRTKPAVGRIIRRAELLRPPAGQRLALIAPGEEGELFRRRLAQWLHP